MKRSVTSWLRLRSLTRGDFRTAYSMVRQNRGRSIVTIFGIVVAVAAVVIIVGVGEGVKSQVQGQANKLGRDLLLIRPGSREQSVAESIGGLSGSQTHGSLSSRDVEAVASVKGVKQAVPLGVIDGVIKTDEHVPFNGAIVATTKNFAEVVRQELEHGSFLGDDEGADGRAVIGADVAADLFGENVPLGRSFEFRGREFIVSGILEPFDSALLLGNTDLNHAIFITYDVAQAMSDNQLNIYQILAQAHDPETVATTAQAIKQKERQVHGGASVVSVLRQGQNVSATDDILELLTQAIIGAAIIALIIGGVGVMNVMLVSVTERMHEIGIRKAVGATNHQILAQFLAESAMLSAIGGAIGFSVGIVVLEGMRIYTDFQPTLPWLSGLTCTLIAVVVGTLFGCFPAFKAARKDPIEALRNQ